MSEVSEEVKTKIRADGARKDVTHPPFEMDGKAYLKDYLRPCVYYFHNVF